MDPTKKRTSSQGIFKRKKRIILAESSQSSEEWSSGEDIDESIFEETSFVEVRTPDETGYL
jgi:hypothetical protein